ncbi:MAG: OmpA family protein [Elusimicrobiota bacterium]|nr:OmpA family protein [Endomicrobiia bacterium]MDW8165759.1 OmpA family protein [Elusimicrobiota bacterium]
MYKKLIYLILCLSFFACPKKVTPPTPQEVTPPTVEEKIEVEEPSVRGEEFISIPELQNVYFEFDKFDLTNEAKEILRKNADYLIANPQYEILVEGHTCECGSNEYNLGLGQKRASAVRDYYINLGVKANRIATISYGEEKPVNPNAGPPDSSLCKPNRRAETKVRVKK